MSVRKCRAVKTTAYSLAQPVETGTVLQDSLKRKWVIGNAIGQGGFGRIYAVKLEGEKAYHYVAKIEPQENGPLFTEMHFYMRVCSENAIKSWESSHSLKYLGIPRYISSGSININKTALRFLVMDRFSGDFESTLKNREISASGILEVSANVLSALEYMHSRDYAHADIKASNLLHLSSKQEVYLADFGLVHLFRSKGVHTVEKPDPKFRHNGTIEFCSRDAHTGLPPSRRGDLEILLFNLIHWLARSHPNAPQLHSTGLPWGYLISDPKLRANVPDRVKVSVADLKEKTMKNPAEFVLQAGYGPNADILAFIQSIKQLGYSDTPDYAYLRKLLHSAKSSIGKQAVSSSHKLTVESNETGVISPPTRRKYNKKDVLKSNDSRALNSVENLDLNNSISKTPDSLPTKKPRGRPPGSSRLKQLENISPVGTSSRADKNISKGSSVNSSNHASKRNAVKSLHASSPNKKSAPVESTSLTPKSGLPNSGNGDTNLPGQQRIRTRLIDLFSDSDDDNDSDEFFASLKKNSSRSRKDVLKSTPKLESPKASPSTRKNHQHLTDNASKQSPFKSPEYTSLVANRRRSGWCQTSPELLAVAKAEALGRRAVKLSEMNLN